MPISVADLAIAVRRLDTAIRQHEQELNAADAKLGDGDTGGMLARVIASMVEQDIGAAADPGTALTTLARAAATATGSSLGTLLATGLLTAGRECKGRPAIENGELADLFDKARAAMMARGGASLGDKTVLDSLDAVVKALTRSPERPAAAAAQAAQEALEEFRNRPSRIGRARVFGDATMGLDDPGMLAFARLASALADPPE